MYRWMCRNAIFYGFVRTVPSEEWHWENILAKEYPRFTLYHPDNYGKPGYKGPPRSMIGRFGQDVPGFREWADKTRFAFVSKNNGKWHKFGRDPLGSRRRTGNGANTYGAVENGYNWTDVPITSYPPVSIPSTFNIGEEERGGFLAFETPANTMLD